MATIRELRDRIRSVNSTKKITKAQELIATSRITKAQGRVAAAAPYAEEIQRVLERLNGDSETDAEGRPRTFDKVALIGVVGNEDGAHKVTADLARGLNDRGFTLPAQGATYWVGEAMGSTDYQDLEQVPEAVASTTATAARNAAHLAGLLKGSRYPAVS